VIDWSPPPTDALAWIRKLDPNIDESRDDVKQVMTLWAPKSLKNISTSVLRIGKRLNLLQEAMVQLAAIENRLRILRNDLGISRKAPSDMLPRATVLVTSGKGWISPGRWIPEVLDRAAIFDPLHATKDEEDRDVFVDADRILRARLDHVILLGAEKPLLKGPTENYVNSPSVWLSSAPAIFDAVFEAASFIHARPDLFSGNQSN